MTREELDLTDAELHEVVVDLVEGILGASRLDDVDIFSTDRLLDLATALSDRELGQGAVARGHSEDVADVVDQLGVGVAPEDDEVPDHLGGVQVGVCRDEDAIANSR